MTRFLFRLFFSCLLSIIVLSSFAQDDPEDQPKNRDTLQYKIRVRFQTLNQFKNCDTCFSPIDTSIEQLNVYDPTDSFLQFRQNTGMYGSSQRSLSLLNNWSPEFKTGINSFDGYRQNSQKLRFFDTYTPFTSIAYAQGPTELQIMDATHSRNINQSWNVTARYRMQNGKGFYLSQKSQVKNFSITTRFISTNKNYQLFGSYLHDKIASQESGGIENDSLFKTYTINEKFAADTRLSDANQLFKSGSVDLTQYLQLSRNGDSLHKSNFPLLVKHHFSFSTERYFFEDKKIDTFYYTRIFNDSANTKDSMLLKKYSNSFSIVNSPLAPFHFDAGFRLEQGKYLQNDLDTNFQSLALCAEIDHRFGNKSPMGYSLTANYGLSGYETGNYLFTENFWILTKDLRLTFGATQNQGTPGYIYDHQSSNHLKWDAVLNPEKINGYSLEAAHKKWLKAEASYQSIQKFHFFNSEQLPVVLNSNLNVLSLKTSLSFQLGKFHLKNLVIYQYFNEDSLQGYPELQSKTKIYLETQMFKKQMHFQLGTEVYFGKPAFLYNYYAPFAIWYAGNQKTMELGPDLKFFFNASIKRFRLYFVMENLLDGLSQSTIYSSPLYPKDPRTYRFGLSYLFYD